MKELELGQRLAATLLVAATGVVPCLGSSGVQDSQKGVPEGYVRLTTIENQEGLSQGASLIAVDWYEDRRIQRLLIRTPKGQHVVLTETEFPLAGVTRFDLLVEETGWEAELEERSGLRFASVWETADPAAFAANFVQAEHSRTVILKAPGLESAFEHSSTTWDDRFFDDFFLVLSAQREAQGLVRAMQTPTREAVQFLNSLTSCGECSVSMGRMELLVAILARALSEEQAQEGEPERTREVWRAKPEFTARQGAGLSPDALRFLEEFQSIQGSDVLADLRPAEGGRPVE
ncbi:MAG TPA: hypothetical protein VLF66_01115 [Thermoanaerobaculia bacterium]|nr:hypothetical protein [Thermoanaerobaculia bacterium]